jgi:hypothetical protein
MKRIIRQILKAFWKLSVILSILVLILAAILSVESFTGGVWTLHHTDHVTEPSIRTARWDIDIDSKNGRFQLAIYPLPERWPDFYEGQRIESLYRFSPTWSNWLIDLYRRDSGRWYWEIWGYYLPIVLMAAVLPGVWCIGWFRRRRLSRMRLLGRCIQCGYDLRATPNRCPECGTPVAGDTEYTA